ncbi:MAG: PEP-CTERM sorting domain-containing protein [Planctomycetota bacterium]
MTKIAAAAAAVTLSIGSAASAQVIYDSEGFEAPDFVFGNVVGQTGGSPDATWVESVAGVPPTAVVQGSVFREGSQALQLDRNGDGSGLFGPSGISVPITDPSNTQRFVGMTWDMTVEDVGDGLTGPFFGASLAVSLGGAPTTISFGVDASDPFGSGTGEVGYFFAGGNFVAITGSDGLAIEVPLSDSDWFTYTIRIDADAGATGTVTFLLGDGVATPLASGPVALPDELTLLTTGVVTTSDIIGGPDGDDQIGTAFYDAFSIEIEAIPEPTSMALLGTLGLGLIRRRRV